MPDRAVEDLLRELAPRVLGALTRRYGHFDTAEDATQEALITAAAAWSRDGVPDNPRGWLITVASRRLTDLLRREQARRRREDVVASWVLPPDRLAAPADRTADGGDDTLVLLFLCCHPALSPATQIALTLRAVGGLSTAEVARAFLVPEATMTRRITRGKQRIRDSGVPFRMPAGRERDQRLAAVLHVLYLIFNEGYASTTGPALLRTDLTAEAIRLTRLLHRLLPDDPEVGGLLALMLLTDARAPARTGPHGELVPMAEQDRRRWNHGQIAEGVALVTAALGHGRPGPYQVQAAIAAVHDEASDAADTDWAQITALYEVLMGVSDSPVVALNHAVAVAMSRGVAEGLALVEALADGGPLASDARLPAVRAHLRELLGDRAGARAAYREAADLSTNLTRQRYLHDRAARLDDRP
ncbi:RNA polymerase sigma factor [Micromonospora endolithica]|uniref:Sigma-70 family RNA polymerase sigma factor n=1 Tax=Micromonospora endolithica TaxID=230091 RepID=A0A3A9YZE5_9ACTN|nr:sigma-70 family RNA polymerase sigma factor [Micromonospora endolithica]RKN41542.1 sigma-70 family RNA polymerase sigma factor [Micromonospora endolithica]TWJ21988.1 RNA polymerase sigma factor (sigma-70 family) [Micromonospora endolithica]